MRHAERYTLARWRYVPLSRTYERTSTEQHATLAAAQRAYTRAQREDGAAPDLTDNLTGECIK